jgi:hypothetical protein
MAIALMNWREVMSRRYLRTCAIATFQASSALSTGSLVNRYQACSLALSDDQHQRHIGKVGMPHQTPEYTAFDVFVIHCVRFKISMFALFKGKEQERTPCGIKEKKIDS